VVEKNQIDLMRELFSNQDFAAQCYLPGIDNHPYLNSFTAEPNRWYICSCGTANFVGDCGNLVQASICINCGESLAERYGVPRPKVHRASNTDFLPFKGIATSLIPSCEPAYTVRNRLPVVTRFCLLLNYLVLMNVAVNTNTSDEAIVKLLRSRTPLENQLNREPNDGEQEIENRRTLICFLSNHILVHLNILCQLLVVNRPNLTRPDQFRIGHLLLHRLLNFQHDALKIHAHQFTTSPQARETFENGLARFLSEESHLELELDRNTEKSDVVSKTFRQSLVDNQTSHWAYTCLVPSNRTFVQLLMARDEHLCQQYPFLDLLLNKNWSSKLDALQHLGDAVRFIALVRTVLQSNITLNEANRMTIDHGLNKIVEAVEQKAVLLDRGRAVSTREDVNQLFESFKSLWDRFSQIPNLEHKTFLGYFECQEVNLNIRPRTILDKNASLILILAGTDLPETT